MVRIDVAPPAPCRHTRKGATLGLGTIEMSAKYLRCIAAYGFLVSERERIPPSRPCYTTRFEKLAVSEGDRSGGSTAEDRTPRPQLDRDDAQKIDHRACQHPFTMPMLRHACRQRLAP